MSENLTDPLWGTGYGSKRHLVDGKPAAHTTKGWRVAHSRCGQVLKFFADAPPRRWLGLEECEAKYVASLPSCARCQKIAEKETL